MRQSGGQEGRTVAKTQEKPATSSVASEPKPSTGLAAPTPPSHDSPLTMRFLVNYQRRDHAKEEK
jgi:hypothetical protein